MAKVNGKFVQGIVGPVIFKKSGDQQLVVARSKNFRMTDSTYNAAQIFGRASTVASYIRNGVHLILSYYDELMISRLTGECNKILQKAATAVDKVFNFGEDSFNRLNGFEFHEASPVKKQLFAQPQVTLTAEQIVIEIPELLIPDDLIFIPNAKYCIVAFSVTLFDFTSQQFKKQEIQSFEIERQPGQFTFPAQQLNFMGAPGALAIISIALFYMEKTFAGKAVLNKQEFCPSAILKAAFCPGESETRSQWSSIHYPEKKKRKNLKKTKKKADQIGSA